MDVARDRQVVSRRCEVLADGQHLDAVGAQVAQHFDDFVVGLADADMAFINSLMKPNHTAGQYASWIAAPRMGINQQPVDYEYVKID